MFCEKLLTVHITHRGNLPQLSQITISVVEWPQVLNTGVAHHGSTATTGL